MIDETVERCCLDFSVLLTLVLRECCSTKFWSKQLMYYHMMNVRMIRYIVASDRNADKAQTQETNDSVTTRYNDIVVK
jgi:hypothetical protein